MKKLCVFLLLVTMSVSSPIVMAGGPDAEIDAHVNGVQVGDDFITFAVYGEAWFFVLKTRDELKQSAEGANTNKVTLRFENRYLVIHRDKDPIPGVTDSWDELKERATAMRDKDVFFQVWGAKITIESSVITRIDAKNVSFVERDKG